MNRFREDSKSNPIVKAFLDAHERGLPLPPLYATLKRDFTGRDRENGGPKSLLTGQRVRVIQVGKFGELGVTTVLEETKRDEARVTLAEMTDYSDKP